jgi:hypothetical protein
MTRHPINVTFFHVDLPLCPGYRSNRKELSSKKTPTHKVAASSIAIRPA